MANTVTAVADKRRAPPGDKRDGLTPDQGPGRAPKKVTVNPAGYPTPTRGTTLGRFCVTCGLAPPRPIMPPAPAPPAPPPIGIGIIGIPPPVGAPAIPAALGIPAPPNPDIAALPIRAGVEPCQVGGTDIAPTKRALPKPAAADPKPPNPLGATASTILGTLAAISEAPARAGVARIPAWAAIMIGDIIKLAG